MLSNLIRRLMKRLKAFLFHPEVELEHVVPFATDRKNTACLQTTQKQIEAERRNNIEQFVQKVQPVNKRKSSIEQETLKTVAANKQPTTRTVHETVTPAVHEPVYQNNTMNVMSGMLITHTIHEPVYQNNTMDFTPGGASTYSAPEPLSKPVYCAPEPEPSRCESSSSNDSSSSSDSSSSWSGD